MKIDMKIIYRYLAYNFILPFFTSGIFFIVFLLVFQVFRILRYLMAKDVEIKLIMQLLANIAVSFAPSAIPLAALFAIIYTLSHLSEDSEMIAMRSFGYSKYRLFAPFFIIGLLISLSVYSLTHTIIPNAQKSFKLGVMRLTSKSLLGNIKKNEFFVDIPRTIFYAEDKRDKEYFNIFISRYDDKIEKEIVAKRGIFIKQKFDEWGSGVLRMKLFDGSIIEFSKSRDVLRKILFKDYEFPIMGGEPQNFSTNKLSTLTTEELMRNLSKVHNNKDRTKIKLEYWSRINTALLPLLFIFLGFSLGIKQGRGRGRSPVALAFLILIAYYVVYFLGVSLAKKAVISAELTVIIPSLILLIIAGHQFKRLNWLA